MSWEPVIGFEVHTELKTDSKVFCGCGTTFGAEPNTQTCPVCLGMPGSLPVLNARAVDLSLRTAIALKCEIAPRTWFDRKNYYYPDLPKNYQISQHHCPLGRNGLMEIDLGDAGTKTIRIHDIHLEEDAGKNLHPEGRDIDYTLVDLNRAGTPLLEIVTAPDIESKDEALAFMQCMRTLLECLDVSECKMQEGRLRFELNISLRRAGEKTLGTKVEVKNVNSVSAILKAIDHEMERQAALLDRGEQVVQETRLWDEGEGATRTMRSKERAHDYRYFPEPDLLELHVSPEWLDRVRETVPELPVVRKLRFMETFGLSGYDANLLTQQRETSEMFETAVARHNNPKGVANWIMGDVLRAMNDLGEDATVRDLKVSAESLADLVRLIDTNVITGKIAKQVIADMLATGASPESIIKEKGLQPVDDAALGPIIDEIIAAHPGPADDVRQGKMKAVGFLMGEVMKRTKGKANAAVVTPLLKKKLGVE